MSDSKFRKVAAAEDIIHISFRTIAKIIIIVLGVTSSQKSLTADGDSDKIDLKKIQDQYWTAKDDDLGVVQNKSFSKTARVFVHTSIGPAINDDWSVGTWNQLGVGFYQNEQMGYELSFQKGNLKKNDSVDRIAYQNGLQPDHNRFLDSLTMSFLWVPFYGKMSLLDKKIFYFDMQFGFGLSSINYENQIDPSEGSNQKKSAIGFAFDITQHFFVSKSIAIRLDLKNQWCRENLQKYRISGSANQNRDLGNVGYQGTAILIGFTYFH